MWSNKFEKHGIKINFIFFIVGDQSQKGTRWARKTGGLRDNDPGRRTSHTKANECPSSKSRHSFVSPEPRWGG